MTKKRAAAIERLRKARDAARNDKSPATIAELVRAIMVHTDATRRKP